MKLSATALATLLVVSASSSTSAAAFVPAASKRAAAVRSAGASFVTTTPSTSSRFGLTRRNMATLTASTPLTIGIVGATGAVGKEIKYVLERSPLPVQKLRVFGSSRSAGSTMETEKFGNIIVEQFDVSKARECDVVFLAVSGDFALEHAKAICEGADGAVVIDNSSAFRNNPEIPLVVPEINGETTKKSKLIANPNCTTAIGLMALWPLHKLFGLKKIIMSTYQAASGAGQEGMEELQEGTKVWLEGGTPVNTIFAHPLPFNLIPHIDKFQENGYTKEEMKVVWESRKICGLPDDFPVSCTAVRIPTIRAHSESIIIETERPVDIAQAREALANTPGVKLVDDVTNNQYPMPLTATGQYDVEVGRIRKSLIFGDYGLEFFVSGDQLLRGAALNAVLVAEEMVKNGSLVAKSSAPATV